ncbi:MAG: hypothetical protein CMH64_04570 [Nanoarchaeota archaeon]|nr:hypothetical protein [Nanoarchaeota archaeon]|tara:strand:- start:3059 stop:3310 length:252 start_codon:yes stop_codon:yes gene_type:complete
MAFKNLKELDFSLKKSFGKIKKDINALEESTKNTMDDLSIIRQNLLEFNSLRLRLEEVEKKLGTYTEEDDKKGFFARIFKKDQ